MVPLTTAQTTRNVALAVDPEVMRDVGRKLRAAGIRLGDTVGGTERTRLYTTQECGTPHRQQTPLPPLTVEEVAKRFRLTAQLLAILRLLADGKSNDEIAAFLGVAPSTVRTHLRRLYPRLGASDRASAVLAGCRLGLIGAA